MDLSQIKLVVSDMDGTLLNSKHEVSNQFFKLFEELKIHDITFVAASGRPHYSITEKLNPIKDEIIIIAENGGFVGRNGTEIASTPLQKNNLVTFENLIDSNSQIHPVFCTKKKAYFKNSSSKFISLLTEYYPSFGIIDSIDEIEEDILKIALYNNEDAKKIIYPEFKHLESTYKVKVSGKHWVDISHNLANKGHALELIQKIHKIEPKETLVFGDYDNDIEMFSLSHFTFAMENANDNIKKIAAYQTKSNDAYGVEIILERLIETKKAGI